MRVKGFPSTLLVFAIAMTMVVAFSTIATANPKERIDYWRKNYEELSPQDDPRAARAHAIFTRVLHAAGKRPGVVPRLFITKTNPLNLSLPIAIPDGSIILSSGVLDLCYRDPERGDDRLAFVLAHEITHQLRDDFWHMRFFQALEASQEKSSRNSTILEELRTIAGLTEQVLAKELQADEYGIVYASMAGFNTNAIVTEDNTVNFFAEWVDALDPSRLVGMDKGPSHPSPQQRAATVKTRLRQILDQVAVFQLGVWFYQAGNYEKAILAFRKFLEFFWGREVYHNLATSHHQLALRYYRLWKREQLALPFKLSFTIDPTTRAREVFRGGQTASTLFHGHIKKAIEFYQTAISLDPSYTLSYTNLGAALILKEDVYRAIATLQDALKINPKSVEALNNLGVAFFYAENPRAARDHLTKAHEIDPDYDASFFNLGKLAYEEKHMEEARRYWNAYLKLDPMSPWAHVLQKTLLGKEPIAPLVMHRLETVMGVEIGTFEDEIPGYWGEPKEKPKRIPLEETPFKMSVYHSGIVTLSQDEEIQMIVALEGYKGKSARGMAIGSGKQDVMAAYGNPSRIVHTTQGVSWVYEAQGIAFQLRQGKVVSWLVF
jgi:tetratricopeptide (TPR) repeat protein